MDDLKKEYENTITDYAEELKAIIEVFEIKQELYFQDWAEDFIVADFGGTDFYSIDDIRHDIDTNQPAGQIVAWQEAVLLNNEKHGIIDYKSWCKGRNYSELKINKNK